jgi:hypothetical protein
MSVTFAKLGQYGRLGNCLFQMATTIAHANKHGEDYIFPRWEYEDDFHLPKSCFKSSVRFDNTFNEPHFHYAGIPHQPNLNLHGYFQSYKYFQDDPFVKQLLSPKSDCELSYALDLVLDGVASIHVRRQDYLIHTGCYNILDMNNYYEKAMEMAGANKFLVFSDDIHWCKRHFIGNQFEFSEGNTPSQDMALMMKCQNNIIANSSFSWWAAYLNIRSEKKVIAPATWFGPKLAPTHDAKDLLLDGWVKV